MKILIACGGTAGHIFPALALAEELKKEDKACQIIMVVSNHRRDRGFLKAAGPLVKELRIETVEAAPFPYNFSFKSVFFMLRLLWALLQSLIIILRYRPDAAIGFGGYASFAPVIAARTFGIPVIIHEQNLRPGRANRLLSRIVDRIAVSFEGTGEFFPRHKRFVGKIVTTGLPLRNPIVGYQRTFPKPADKFNILIFGGSQGAHKINELALDCLRLMDKQKLAGLHFTHLSGKQDLCYVQAGYEALGVDFEVFDFLEDMAGVYRNADLLIGRSGAGTIFEAAAFGLPCLLLPHSRGTRHQKENALFLQRRGCALVLDEEDSSARDLKRTLVELIDNSQMRRALSQRIKTLQTPGATRYLKEELLALCRGS
jgi:UDP-N-acetylglucosamine--N-acetylmuramyl-(pentapeptide) pyrophosphoryl-undecaprenol N-acetylglucosamine transferase